VCRDILLDCFICDVIGDGGFLGEVFLAVVVVPVSFRQANGAGTYKQKQ
jgi:hypothetical protein